MPISAELRCHFLQQPLYLQFVLTLVQDRNLHVFGQKFTIGPTSYRGSERRTLKTAEKQPKRVPRGLRVKCRRNSRKTAGKTREACKTAVFRLFGCPSGCFLAVFPALYSGATRHLFRLFFGCFQGPAFGAFVAGRADRNQKCRNPFFCSYFRNSFFAKNGCRKNIQFHFQLVYYVYRGLKGFLNVSV